MAILGLFVLVVAKLICLVGEVGVLFVGVVLLLAEVLDCGVACNGCCPPSPPPAMPLILDFRLVKLLVVESLFPGFIGSVVVGELLLSGSLLLCGCGVGEGFRPFPLLEFEPFPPPFPPFLAAPFPLRVDGGIV